MKKLLIIFIIAIIFCNCSKESEKNEDIPEWIIGKWQATLLAEDSLFTKSVKYPEECISLSVIEFKEDGCCYSYDACENKKLLAKFHFVTSQPRSYINITEGYTLIWGAHVTGQPPIYYYDTSTFIYRINYPDRSLIHYVKMQRID